MEMTAVVNLHREGALCVPSVRSAQRAVQHAARSGLTAEVLLVLDSGDDDTREVVSRLADQHTRSAEIDVEDLGHARNAGVVATDARFIAFLDSDDLWGHEWLTRAHTAATTLGREAAWHPEVSFFFGDTDEDATVYHHLPSTDPQFDHARFRMHNSWTALSFGPRSLYDRWPYPRNQLEKGFGFEDWSWNEATLSAGVEHLVVPDTCHFISKASARTSLLAESGHAIRTPYRQQR